MNLWHCVTCTATIDRSAMPLFAERWLCTRAGRFCERCRKKIEASRPGGYVELGGGVRLLVTEAKS